MKNKIQTDDVIQNWRIRRLFRAVLVRAAKDAYLMKGLRLSRVKKRDEALNFFKDAWDLKIICSLADVDFNEVWKIANENMVKNKEKYNKIIICILKNVSLFY